MKYVLITLTTFWLAFAAPSPSYAGNAPAWHVGTFSKKATLKTCVGFAKAALEKEHFKIYAQDNNTVIAGNDNVVAQVSCSPLAGGKIWVVVTAYSNDSSLAEGTRNRVREYIVKVVLFDN